MRSIRCRWGGEKSAADERGSARIEAFADPRASATIRGFIPD